MAQVISIGPVSDWPKTTKEVREASDQQVWQWKNNQSERPVDFVIDLAIMHEYDKRYGAE